MEMNVVLEKFEGPLDLLLHLIEKNKVNIYDIPISQITNQYLDYLRKMNTQDLNIMSEFLLMAATLLDIKSKLLLPVEATNEGEVEDPRTELVEQLLQYKMFKFISQELKDRQLDAHHSYFKAATLPKEVSMYHAPIDLEDLCAQVDLKKLNEIFNSILRRQEDRIDPIRAKFGKIQQEEISVEEAMANLELYAKTNKQFSFCQLLEKQQTKMAIIVTFLAILELMKLGKIQIVQPDIFDDIQITSLMIAS